MLTVNNPRAFQNPDLEMGLGWGAGVTLGVRNVYHQLASCISLMKRMAQSFLDCTVNKKCVLLSHRLASPKSTDSIDLVTLGFKTKSHSLPQFVPRAVSVSIND